MAEKKAPKGSSIVDRWNEDVPEQFVEVKTSRAEKAEVERLRKELANKQFRDWVKGNK